MPKFTQKLLVQNIHRIYFLMQLSQQVPVINSALNCYSSDLYLSEFHQAINLYLSEFHQTINAKIEFEIFLNLKFLMVHIRTVLYRTASISSSQFSNYSRYIGVKAKVFLEIYKKSQENTCAAIFLTKLQAGNLKKETPETVFCSGFCKVLRTRILRNTCESFLLYSNTFNTVTH